jgi:hypothetical protein
MSGLEIAGFIVGLGGLGSIFDRACLIWKTISQASEYGEDVANSMTKIQMEYFRFQMWWTALQNLAADSPSKLVEPDSAPTGLVASLRARMENPLVSTTSAVLKLLEELEKVLTKNDVLQITTARAPVATAASQNAEGAGKATLELDTEVKRFRDRQQKLSKDLLQSISWWKRLKHDAAPWREADKQLMARIHADLSYWNNSLYGILPHNVRESVLQQGIAGYILDTDDNAFALSQTSEDSANQTASAIEYAQLIQLRQRTRIQAGEATTENIPSIVDNMRKKHQEIHDLPDYYDSTHPFSVLTAEEPAKCKLSPNVSSLASLVADAV